LRDEFEGEENDGFKGKEGEKMKLFELRKEYWK